MNYEASTINLVCINIPDQQILNNLIQYVSRYVTTATASSVRQEVHQIDKPTILRKCIDYLIGFTYEHIYKKRRIAMDNMESAVQRQSKKVMRLSELRLIITLTQDTLRLYESKPITETFPNLKFFSTLFIKLVIIRMRLSNSEVQAAVCWNPIKRTPCSIG